MMQLFYDTVHTINRVHYSKEQLYAWAKTPRMCWQKWNSRFSECYSLLAFNEEELIGFGSLDGDYLDMLYIHHHYQRKGVGSVLVRELLFHARGNNMTNITTHASLTAVPFLEHLGFRQVRENQVKKNGVVMTNILMQKSLTEFQIQENYTESSEKKYA